MTASDTPGTNAKTLVEQTVAIINDALAEDAAGTPDNEQPLLRHMPIDRQVGLAVFSANPVEPEAEFALHFDRDRLRCETAHCDSPRVTCKVARERLEHICEDPNSFATNPMDNDMFWLLSRMAA